MDKESQFHNALLEDPKYIDWRYSKCPTILAINKPARMVSEICHHLSEIGNTPAAVMIVFDNMWTADILLIF